MRRVSSWKIERFRQIHRVDLMQDGLPALDSSTKLLEEYDRTGSPTGGHLGYADDSDSIQC